MILNFLRGDFRHFFPENIIDFVTTPLAWDSSLNTGVGVSQVGSLWITSYLNFTATFSKLGFSWEFIQLIFWILPAILISFGSSIYLFQTLFKFRLRYGVLAGLIYTLNTYFLMVLTGGQLGVALGYSLTPLILARFIKLIKKTSLGNSLILSLVLGLQLIFDPRLVYISLGVISIYSLFYFREIKQIKNKALLILPLIASVLLNSFWILPLILSKSSPIPQGFDSIAGFQFFSFGDFSKSLSLLHPNFPENIFGKTYFLRPEFLLLPILAFSSLLFKKRREIIYFAIIGLIGTFLAKGASEPFGQINVWLFENFPGMSIFRDPTKFYLLIALSYSILIPFSIFNFANVVASRLSIKSKLSSVQNLFLLFTICYLLFTIRPLWLGEQREIFKVKEIPKEYAQLKNFLATQPQFFRTLWIPTWQRFGFFSNNHPAIGREEIFKGDYKNQIEHLENREAQQLLQDLSVKYIIVPFDSQGEFFLTERQYDNRQYLDATLKLEKISWLKRVDGFEKPAIFEISDYKDHFWSPSTTLGINYEHVNPAEYRVQVRNANTGDLLVFSEGFDKNWTIEGANFKVQSAKFDERFNSFVLPQEGSYDLKAYYEPQKWVNAGLLVGVATLLAIFGFLILNKNNHTPGV